MTKKTALLIVTMALLIISCAVILSYVGRSVYKVLTISSTIPPIAKYSSFGSVDGVLSGIKALDTSSNKQFLMTDTVGNEKNGYAYDFRLDIIQGKRKIQYDLRCENNEAGSTIIQLIGAHDLTNDIGGYGIKAVGMKELLDIFKSEVLGPLKEKQGIELIELNK